ncbi:GGDEF domain-containing protein, partial [Pseudomonas sp. JR33AA]|uniref:GGDEF domain-containing protein n=1 Tax=Pseudomonas sp. JR33AA TaxID=2899113 RepID=UPI001F25BD5E
NESGNEVLAGYALIPSSHWGVVSQQPLANIQASLQATTVKVAKGVAPLGLFGLLMVWWIGRKISVPLSRLAENAQRLDAPECYERISAIPADYIESWQIRRALLVGASLLQEKIGRLNLQAQSDPLTGLANRRGMDEAIGVWQDTLKSFAVISVDIDHFKLVNDTYGHGAGDETLREVARLMKHVSRPEDLVCRIGGEEFALLLPNSSISVATAVAERLRVAVDSAKFEVVDHITISLGVALWKKGESVKAALEQADQLLYRAKSLGRNRVVSEKPNLAVTG